MAVAMANRVNANLLHNWVVGGGLDANANAPRQQSTGSKEHFIALPLLVAAVPEGDIRIGLRRGPKTVAIA